MLIENYMCRESSENVLEEDVYKNDEGIAPSRRRRKKKTATYVAWSTCLLVYVVFEVMLN
jgi:hypothetical protein